MENQELPAKNEENIEYMRTENQSFASRFEEKKVSIETKNYEITGSTNPEIKKDQIYVGIPILTLVFAETLIYLGRLREAAWIHMIILIGLSLSISLRRSEEVRKTYQALMLLPLFRLISFSMPVFFEITIYSLILIYATLAVAVAIASIYQQLSLEELGITFRKIWLYLPLSVLIGAGMGMGEYMIVKTDPLIPDISPLSLLKLTVVGVFFVGLVEEVIFRSFLQTRLSKILGVWKGILISSIIFGFMHSGYGTFYEILYASFVGVVIGYMFYKTRSLPLSTLVNGFTNIFFLGIIPHLAPVIGLFR